MNAGKIVREKRREYARGLMHEKIGQFQVPVNLRYYHQSERIKIVAKKQIKVVKKEMKSRFWKWHWRQLLIMIRREN